MLYNWFFFFSNLIASHRRIYIPALSAAFPLSCSVPRFLYPTGLETAVQIFALTFNSISLSLHYWVLLFVHGLLPLLGSSTIPLRKRRKIKQWSDGTCCARFGNIRMKIVTLHHHCTSCIVAFFTYRWPSFPLPCIYSHFSIPQQTKADSMQIPGLIPLSANYLRAHYRF